MFHKSLLLSFLTILSLKLTAQNLYENFTYGQETLLTQNGWQEHSGNGNNAISLVQGLVFENANDPTAAARLNGGGQDVNRNFDAINTGSVYYRFLIKVSQASSDGEYFTHLGPNTLGTEFRARVFVKDENGGLRFGISKSSNSPNYTLASFDYNDIYMLVVKYTFNGTSNSDDQVALAVFKAGESRSREEFMVEAKVGEFDASNIGSVALRQGSSGKAPSLVIDELKIAPSWQDAVTLITEPSLSINLPEDLYAFNSSCREQAIFEGSLNANAQGAMLNLWSPDASEIRFSKDKKTWQETLTFSSTTGNYAQKFWIKYNGSLNAASKKLVLKVDNFDADELLEQSILFRGLGLREDCSIGIADFKTLAPGEIARVTGVAAATAREFGFFNYIQDELSGLRINGDYNWEIGDSVSIFGIKGATFDEIIIERDTCCDTSDAVQKRGKGTLNMYQTSIENIANFEGRLVQLSGLSLQDNRFVFLPNTNEQLSGGGRSLETRIWGSTDIDGYQKPTQAGTWQGVVGQFRGKYQLYPRTNSDITGLSEYQFPTSQFDKSQTFDLAAWNVEWFGSPTNGPRDDEQQLENVAATLNEIDADALVLTEVTSLEYFDRLVASLPSHSGACSPAVSGGFTDGEAQRVCLVYKSAIVKLQEIRPLLSGTPPISDYPESFDRFWASGRLPALFVCDVNLNGISRRLHIVGIHARANRSDPAERELVYRMRKKDIAVLKDSLDTHFSAASVIMAGDFNDDLDESVVFGITESSYSPFVQDQENWNMVSKSLSDKGYKSYIGFENVIDHIGISNELNASYLNGSVFLDLPFRFIDDYSNTTSDHLPVVARFMLEDIVTSNQLTEVDSIIVFPNPTRGNLNILLQENVEVNAELFDQKGILLLKTSGEKLKLQKRISKELTKAGPGLYLLKLIIGNEVKTYKIVNQ